MRVSLALSRSLARSLSFEVCPSSVCIVSMPEAGKKDLLCIGRA